LSFKIGPFDSPCTNMLSKPIPLFSSILASLAAVTLL
jgi:hypothetical protein